MTWIVAEKQPMHGRCPICGRDGMYHMTTVIDDEIGRTCACGATFPISLEDEPRSARKIYLSDGAYAEYDGESIILTAEDGIRVLERVVLDDVGVRLLKDFLKVVGW